MSGPGCRPKSRNSRAAPVLKVRQDQENTARTSVPTSPPWKVSRAAVASRSSVASTARGKAGRVPARAAAMARASGSRAQRAMMSATAPGSAATRSAPRRRASRSRASATDSMSSVSRLAPSVATSGVSWLRLVTMARHPGEPGSSGRTCPASRALSSTTSTRLPASRLRYSPTWAGRPAGICSAGTPNASRNPRRASAGSSAGPPGSKPRRLTYSCPSGNRAATRCAQCTARAVLPTPAVPETAEMTAAPGCAEPGRAKPGWIEPGWVSPGSARPGRAMGQARSHPGRPVRRRAR